LNVQPGELGLEQEAHADGHRLLLSGELDLATSPTLASAVARLCREGAGEIVLDLRGLQFIDSTGIRTILHAVDLCARHECELALIRGSSTTQRLFELTGLEEKLPFREPRESELDPSSQSTG
jgi:anti-sigma B factor antagonist